MSGERMPDTPDQNSPTFNGQPMAREDGGYVIPTAESRTGATPSPTTEQQPTLNPYLVAQKKLLKLEFDLQNAHNDAARSTIESQIADVKDQQSAYIDGLRQEGYLTKIDGFLDRYEQSLRGGHRIDTGELEANISQIESLVNSKDRGTIEAYVRTRLIEIRDDIQGAHRMNAENMDVINIFETQRQAQTDERIIAILAQNPAVIREYVENLILQTEKSGSRYAPFAEGNPLRNIRNLIDNIVTNNQLRIELTNKIDGRIGYQDASFYAQYMIGDGYSKAMEALGKGQGIIHEVMLTTPGTKKALDLLQTSLLDKNGKPKGPPGGYFRKEFGTDADDKYAFYSIKKPENLALLTDKKERFDVEARIAIANDIRDHLLNLKPLANEGPEGTQLRLKQSQQEYIDGFRYALTVRFAQDPELAQYSRQLIPDLTKDIMKDLKDMDLESSEVFSNFRDLVDLDKDTAAQTQINMLPTKERAAAIAKRILIDRFREQAVTSFDVAFKAAQLTGYAAKVDGIRLKEKNNDGTYKTNPDGSFITSLAEIKPILKDGWIDPSFDKPKPLPLYLLPYLDDPNQLLRYKDEIKNLTGRETLSLSEIASLRKSYNSAVEFKAKDIASEWTQARLKWVRKHWKDIDIPNSAGNSERFSLGLKTAMYFSVSSLNEMDNPDSRGNPKINEMHQYADTGFHNIFDLTGRDRIEDILSNWRDDWRMHQEMRDRSQSAPEVIASLNPYFGDQNVLSKVDVKEHREGIQKAMKPLARSERAAIFLSLLDGTYQFQHRIKEVWTRFNNVSLPVQQQALINAEIAGLIDGAQKDQVETSIFGGTGNTTEVNKKLASLNRLTNFIGAVWYLISNIIKAGFKS